MKPHPSFLLAAALAVGLPAAAIVSVKLADTRAAMRDLFR